MLSLHLDLFASLTEKTKIPNQGTTCKYYLYNIFFPYKMPPDRRGTPIEYVLVDATIDLQGGQGENPGRDSPGEPPLLSRLLLQQSVGGPRRKQALGRRAPAGIRHPW